MGGNITDDFGGIGPILLPMAIARCRYYHFYNRNHACENRK